MTPFTGHALVPDAVPRGPTLSPHEHNDHVEHSIFPHLSVWRVGVADLAVPWMGTSLMVAFAYSGAFVTTDTPASSYRCTWRCFQLYWECKHWTHVLATAVATVNGLIGMLA